MASNKIILAEGSSINRPPSFNGEAYDYWKIRMKIFIEAQDMDIWNVIENGPYVPHDMIEGEMIIKKRENWSLQDKQLVQFDFKAKNILTSALGFDEFYRVSHCKTAKEMWDTLQDTHEGTKEVKRSRLNTLCQEYELFRMKQGEGISEMQKRFTHIVNHLRSLGKVYTADELNLKVLRSLGRQWQPKVTAISEKKSLSTMTLATLFGKLQEHEMELNRLEEVESYDKGRGKSIALKANTEKNDNESQSESSSDEEITLLAKKFRRFLKKKQFKKNFKPKKNDNAGKSTCFECGKTGHFRSECPDFKKKQDKPEKKFKKKPKKAYIAWEDNDSTATSSSSELEEQANLCLMADCDTEILDISDSSSSVSSFSSSPDISYDKLYNAFQELLSDSTKIEKENKRLKSQVESLSKDNKDLKVEIDKLNLQVKFMDSTSLIMSDCKNCHKLEMEITKLKTTSKNRKAIIKKKSEKKDTVLDTLLKSQRKYANKQGLGYVPKARNTNKTGSRKTVFVKQKKLPVCNYCMKKGHISTNCFIRMYGIKNGKSVWVVKGTHGTNKHGPSVTCLHP